MNVALLVFNLGIRNLFVFIDFSFLFFVVVYIFDFGFVLIDLCQFLFCFSDAFFCFYLFVVIHSTLMQFCLCSDFCLNRDENVRKKKELRFLQLQAE